MKKIIPMNEKLIVSPITIDYKRTDGGIDVSSDLAEGIVVEVSQDLSQLYKIDDHILYPIEAGKTQYYKGKSCLWIEAILIWGIVEEDTIVKDKGDNL